MSNNFTLQREYNDDDQDASGINLVAASHRPTPDLPDEDCKLESIEPPDDN